VEAQPALVGPDRAVHLDPEAAVHLDLAAIVHPRNAEHEDALRLGDPLEDFAERYWVTVQTRAKEWAIPRQPDGTSRPGFCLISSTKSLT
jgi:hypothetical protein